jgi:hypothetical protein
MAYKILTKCPVCEGELKAIKLTCTSCQTSIDSEFTFSKFEQLSSEQLNFIEVFIKSRGIIKDVEKELGISYPTVRGKLDDVIRALGYTVTTEKDNSSADIIGKLESGEISPEEAIRQIKQK